MIREFKEEAAETSYLDYAIHAILLGDDDVEEQVPEMMDMGVISFKMYMTYPRRGMMMPDDRMLKAMELASERGGIAMVHAENGYCIDYLVDKAIEEGHTGREHYAPSQPRVLEIEAANRAATYAQVTDCPLYIVHLSAREMIPVLERFRGEDMNLFGETCPQYLDLTNQKMLDFGALAKIGPPLREREDNEAMWRGLSSHLIDTIASDFCGHKKSQKASYDQETDPDVEASIFDATFGGNWAEQMLCVAYQEGVNMGRLTLPRLVQVMCENPAKIFGIYPQKGIPRPWRRRRHRALRPLHRAYPIRRGPALHSRLHHVRGQAGNRPARNDHAARPDNSRKRHHAAPQGPRRVPPRQPQPGRLRPLRPQDHVTPASAAFRLYGGSCNPAYQLFGPKPLETHGR